MVQQVRRNTATVVPAAKADLADSALHAPAASFADQEFYPDFVDKAAVLVVRLTKNHPLPDGNKRAAWASLRLFLAYNHWVLDPYPSVDEAETAMLAIAAGTWDEKATAERRRRTPNLTPWRYPVAMHRYGDAIAKEQPKEAQELFCRSANAGDPSSPPSGPEGPRSDPPRR